MAFEGSGQGQVPDPVQEGPDVQEALLGFFVKDFQVDHGAVEMPAMPGAGCRQVAHGACMHIIMLQVLQSSRMHTHKQAGRA